MPALVEKIPWLCLPRRFGEKDIITHSLAFLFSSSGGK
jgi:hypothetical protein